MTNTTEFTTYLSELTPIQVIAILCSSILCCTAIWSMLTYITIRLANSAKGQNKKLLDNMRSLDTKPNNLTKN